MVFFLVACISGFVDISAFLWSLHTQPTGAAYCWCYKPVQYSAVLAASLWLFFFAYVAALSGYVGYYGYIAKYA